MSRTIRRNKFNKKNRFFNHYWEIYSEQELKKQTYIEVWKYHSDNYYTKNAKEVKQFFKSQKFNQTEQEFKKKAHQLQLLDFSDDNFDIVMEHHYLYNIKHHIH